MRTATGRTRDIGLPSISTSPSTIWMQRLPTWSAPAAPSKTSSEVTGEPSRSVPTRSATASAWCHSSRRPTQMASFDVELDAAPGLVVQQRKELVELFGYETRNKYEIRTQSGQQLGFAAEQQKGVLGFLVRQLVGHWRS